MRTRNHNNVTMKDIAEEAGVTLTTVSRILNQKGGKYAEKTKEKIFDIAARLKYRPNALVRGMQTGSTGTAGVMVPASGFYIGVVAGIHEVFVNNNAIMLLSWNNRDQSSREETLERQIIHQMIDRRVDGIILRSSSEEFERSYFEEIWEREIPLILVDRHIAKIDANFVGTDDQAGGRAAAEHLIALGHRSMLFVGAGQTVSTSRDREEGFRRVMSESPNAHCRSLVFQTETIRDEIAALLGGENAPTAIFCYNDTTARDMVSVLRAERISIPRDISLIGFGNVPVCDDQLSLTTFDQHQLEIGKAAAELYLECTRAEDRSSAQTRLIKPDLIIRRSTGPVGRR
jgi:LacI family transcriptional regulator